LLGFGAVPAFALMSIGVPGNILSL
jgi:hypothetical protein